ncbi:MAG: hypothetical protein AB7E80_11370 [Hyphomicrobiaceae bacterium]
MTRQQVNSKLRQVYVAIGLVLVVSIVAALAPVFLVLPPEFEKAAAKVYEFMRDMSLLIATLAAAYLANVFQKRSTFVAALEREWRGIVATKTALYNYCETAKPDAHAYLAAFCRISETIDNMRIVYKNAGETDGLVGLYPYVPLHDMRRALQSIDPRKNPGVTPAEHKFVRDAILQAFYALRETFLEELDLEEPRHPLLIAGARRIKKPGATAAACNEQDEQRRDHDRHVTLRPEIGTFLLKLSEEEKAEDARRAQPRAVVLDAQPHEATVPPQVAGR